MPLEPDQRLPAPDRRKTPRGGRRSTDPHPCKHCGAEVAFDPVLRKQRDYCAIQCATRAKRARLKRGAGDEDISPEEIDRRFQAAQALIRRTRSVPSDDPTGGLGQFPIVRD